MCKQCGENCLTFFSFSCSHNFALRLCDYEGGSCFGDLRVIVYICRVVSMRCPKYIMDMIENLRYKICTVLALLSLLPLEAMADTDKRTVMVIPVQTEIGAKSWRYLQSGMASAEACGADAIVLHVNTYGGEVQYADSMRTRILRCKVPVVAFVDNNAASAGALISIACDSIYMSSGANIGAATVVSGTGEAMPDKYQSYMRSIMRSTAQAHGKVWRVDTLGTRTAHWRRDPLVAEAMVDPRTVVKWIGDDSARVVSFTTEEAIRYHFCEGQESSVESVVAHRLGYKECEIRTYEPGFADELVGFFSSGAVQAILIMIIVGGIYFELQTPGVGFPSVASAVAAILYFSPLYIDGLAQGWEIVAFALGVLLLLIEIFVIPGFGVAGISGLVLIFLSLMFAMLDNTSPVDFGFTTGDDVMGALLVVIIGLLLGVALILVVMHYIGHKGFMRHSALVLEQKVEEGYVGVPVDLAGYVGGIACAVTVLRPAGKVRMDDGEIVDAVSAHEFIEAGERVKVLKYENAQLYVAKAE